MRVLLSAYACDPENGSEPGVGWQVLRAALAACDHVTLLTRENNVAAVAAALTPRERAGLTIHGFDLPAALRRAKRHVPGGVQGYYLGWQLGARSLVRSLVARRRFDVAHHVTFAVDWMPTALDAVTGRVPVVWGPVGGSSHTPLPLLPALGLRGGVAEAARWGANVVGRGSRRSPVDAYALCVAQNDDVARWLSRRTSRIVCEPNAFVDPSALPSRDSVDSDLLIGVGRLLPWKGWALAIRAMKHLPGSMRLELVGTGPDEARLKRIAESAGVAGRVHFLGHVRRDETLARMSRARAMMFPSLHDSASTAMGEALAMGCPVVALPLGGSGVMLRRSGALPVELCSDIPRALAAGVLRAGCPAPAEAWSTARLPGLLDEWYQAATANSAQNLRRVL